MDLALNSAAVLLPVLYLAVAVAYGFRFFDPEVSLAQRLGRPLLLTTLFVHLGYLVLLAVRYHQFPAATVSQALSAVAFTLALVYAIVEWRGQDSSTGFWALSFAFLFETSSALLRTEPPDYEIFHSPLFAVHASLGLLGYSAFVLAAGYGFLFLRLYGEIKRRRFSVFFGKLPSLEVLEQMMSVALLVGFVAFTGAVATGAVWAEQLYSGGWLSDPKIGVSVVTWLVYGSALLLRRIRRWHGRQTAIASLFGFAAILFSLVAVNLFFTDLHGFY